MKRLTYDIFDGNNQLFYEEHYDNSGRVVYSKDHRARPATEIFQTYDEAGRLVEMRELSGGIEVNKSEHQFAKDGKPLMELIYVNNELYEKVTFEHVDGGYIRRRYEGDEEFERQVYHEKGNSWTRQYFLGNELLEVQSGEYDEGRRVEIWYLRDGNGLPISTAHLLRDNLGNTIKSESFNDQGNIERLELYEYEGDLMIKEIDIDYTEQERFSETHYTYNSRSQLVGKHVYDRSGKIMEWCEFTYDAKNSLIEEKGFSLGSIYSTYISYFSKRGFHFRHDYQD